MILCSPVCNVSFFSLAVFKTFFIFYFQQFIHDVTRNFFFIYYDRSTEFLVCLSSKIGNYQLFLSSDIVSVPFSPPFLELLFTFKLGHVLPVPNALFIRFSILFAMLFILDTFYITASNSLNFCHLHSFVNAVSDFILFHILYFSVRLFDSFLIVFVSLLKIPVFSFSEHFLLHL